MCGILVSIRALAILSGHLDTSFEEIWQKLLTECALRGQFHTFHSSFYLSTDIGPDDSKTITKVFTPKDAAYSVEIRMFASELQLRGSSKVVQPHVWDDDVLCWNGEVGYYLINS